MKPSSSLSPQTWSHTTLLINSVSSFTSAGGVCLVLLLPFFVGVVSSAIRVYDWSDILREARPELCKNGLGLCSARENLSSLLLDWYNETLLSPNEMSYQAFAMSPCFCDPDCLKYGDCCVDFAARPRNWGNGDEEFSEYYECHPLQDEADSVYMAARCPSRPTGTFDSDEIDAEIARKCMRSPSIPDEEYSHFLDLPVHSTKTGRTYVNVYCAMCHGEDVRNDLVRWNMTVACLTNVTGYTPEEFMREAEYKRGELRWIRRIWNDTESNILEMAVDCRLRVKEFENIMEFVEDYQGRRCKMHTIDNCPSPATPFGSSASLDSQHLHQAAFDTNDDIAMKCNLYRMSVRVSKTKYRNLHCAACNGINVSQTMKFTECDGTPSPFLMGGITRGLGFGYIPSFSVIFDFSGGDSSEAAGVGQIDRCPGEFEIWDDVHQTCHAITCGKLYKNVKGKCVRRSNIDRLIFGETNETSSLTSDCFTVDLQEGDFAFIDDKNGSVALFINKTRQLRRKGEYEAINSTSVRICANPDSAIYFKFTSAQAYVSLVCLTLSLVCLAAHVFIYSILPKLRNLPGKNLLALSSCLFVAQLLFISGIGGNESKWLCVLLGATMHYFFLASFMWMNVMSFDVFKTFNKTTYHGRSKTKLFRLYSAYAWGIPAIVVAFGIIADYTQMSPEYAPHFAQPLCWFNNRQGLAILFALPVAALILENLIFFALSAYGIYKQQEAAKVATKTGRVGRMASSTSGKQSELTPTMSSVKLRKKQSSDQQKRKNRNRLILYLKLAVIMGLGWIFGFVAGFANVPWLWYLFFIFNGLQGVMIFVAFDCKKNIMAMVVETLTGRQIKAWKGSTTSGATAKTTSTTTSGRINRGSSRVSGTSSAKTSVVAVPAEIEPMLLERSRDKSSMATVAKIRPTSREKSETEVTSPLTPIREEAGSFGDGQVPPKKTKGKTSFVGSTDTKAPPKPSRKASAQEVLAAGVTQEPKESTKRPLYQRPDSLPVDLEALTAQLMRQKAREVLAAKLQALEKARETNKKFVMSRSDSDGIVFDHQKPTSGTLGGRGGVQSKSDEFIADDCAEEEDRRRPGTNFQEVALRGGSESFDGSPVRSSGSKQRRSIGNTSEVGTEQRRGDIRGIRNSTTMRSSGVDSRPKSGAETSSRRQKR